MYLFHRFILKELLAIFLLSILFLNFTLMMEKLLRLSRLLAGVGASALDMVQIFLYLQPQILILTIPMAMLLAVLLTYGRLNADNELFILRGVGLSFKTIARPVTYLGLTCFLVSLIMSFYIGPWGSMMLRGKVTSIIVNRAPLAIEEGIFNTTFKDMVILVREKSAPDTLDGIFIMDERNKLEPKVITAERGKTITQNGGLGFILEQGTVSLTGKNSLTKIAFGKYFFRLNPRIEPASRKGSEYTTAELLLEADSAPEKRIPLLLEFHRRLSLPAVCLIIIFLGPALSLVAGKSGRLGGLSIGLIVFAAYYALLIYGENLVRSGTLPHFVGAWLSFLLLGWSSYMAYDRVNRR